MPILLVLALTATCLPLDWPRPLFGFGEEFGNDRVIAETFTATAVALALTAALALRTWVIRTLRHSPDRKVEVAQVYSRLRYQLFFVNMGLVTLCVLVFGWGWLIKDMWGKDAWGKEIPLPPFAELAVPSPYFVILLGAWLLYYDAERTLHRTTVHGHNERLFWSRAGYFFNHLRQFTLLVMLPVLLFVTQQTVARSLPLITQSEWYLFGSLLATPLLLLFMPLLIKPLLGLRSMPSGPVRTQLEALAKRLHFKCTDYLLWPTHGAIANAMIVGLLPRVRYVIFTDRILEELHPDELDAVFGHEVGHAKHGHIWLYAGFLALSISTLAAAILLLGQQMDAAGVVLPKWVEGWLALSPLILMGSYIFLVFGYLSRRCERQADVYGCRAISCSDPNCLGHDGATQYPEKAKGLCPTGIRTFVSALQRVDLVNGNTGYDEEHSRTIRDAIRGLFKWLRSWQHSTMSRRIAFLRSLIDNPQNEQRFQRRVTGLRWALILALAATFFGLGTLVGWGELLKAM